MVTRQLPHLDPDLRAVMTGFFSLVSAQTAEVGRTRQRCARRIKRFVASGTLEQSRGVTRQLNDALASAHELLSRLARRQPYRHRGAVGPDGLQFDWRRGVQDP